VYRASQIVQGRSRTRSGVLIGMTVLAMLARRNRDFHIGQGDPLHIQCKNWFSEVCKPSPPLSECNKMCYQPPTFAKNSLILDSSLVFIVCPQYCHVHHSPFRMSTPSRRSPIPHVYCTFSPRYKRQRYSGPPAIYCQQKYLNIKLWDILRGC
jgi:hypothetical protein